LGILQTMEKDKCDQDRICPSYIIGVISGAPWLNEINLYGHEQMNRYRDIDVILICPFGKLRNIRIE
jgi:hypothetical protein